MTNPDVEAYREYILPVTHFTSMAPFRRLQNSLLPIIGAVLLSLALGMAPSLAPSPVLCYRFGLYKKRNQKVHSPFTCLE